MIVMYSAGTEVMNHPDCSPAIKVFIKPMMNALWRMILEIEKRKTKVAVENV
jgi:hypothetical protein